MLWVTWLCGRCLSYLRWRKERHYAVNEWGSSTQEIAQITYSRDTTRVNVNENLAIALLMNMGTLFVYREISHTCVGCNAICVTIVKIQGWMTGQIFLWYNPFSVMRFSVTRGLTRMQQLRRTRPEYIYIYIYIYICYIRLSHWWKNIGWGCVKMGCSGRYLGTGGRR